jgi:proteasome lid subunit RPN8/RPN11
LGAGEAATVSVMALDSVILGRLVQEAVVAHAREAAPAECCGLLIGRGDSISLAVRARNLSSNPKRFEIDPADHIRVRRDARGRGLDVLGFYHSHPASAAVPSPSDVAEAFDSESVHLIVSLRTEPAEVRLYRIGEGGFVEVRWRLE